GRVARVVPEPDRLDEILVESKGARDDARDRRRLERVGHPSPVVVAVRIDEDLRLSLQPAERLRVDEPVAVSLERRPHGARLLVALPTARLVGAHGERRQGDLLERALTLGERLRDPARDLHASRVVAASARSSYAAPYRLRTSGTDRRRRRRRCRRPTTLAGRRGTRRRPRP